MHYLATLIKEECTSEWTAGAKGSNRWTSWAKRPWFKPVRLVHLSFHRLPHSLAHSGNPSRGDPKQARREANGLLRQAEAWGTSERASPRPLPPLQKGACQVGGPRREPDLCKPTQPGPPGTVPPRAQQGPTPALAHLHRSPVPSAPLCPHLPAGAATLQARRKLPVQAALHGS